jgi:hypothetical protein
VITALLLVAALTAAAGGELALRQLTRHRIEAAAPALGGGLTVEEPGSALWHALDGRIPLLDVTSHDAHLGPLTGVDVDARLHDLRLGSGPATVSASTAEVTVPTASLTAAVQAAAPSLPVDDVTGDPATGTFALSLSGLGRVVLRPDLTAGRLSFTATAATVLGRPLPATRLDQLTTRLNTAIPHHTYPLALTPTGLRVTTDSLHLTFTGGAAALGAR